MSEPPEEPTDESALAHARAQALRAIRIIDDVMTAPKTPRGAQTRLAAAVKMLEIAGIGALEADQRYTEVLRLLKKRLPREVYAQVVRAFAEVSGIAVQRTPAH